MTGSGAASDGDRTRYRRFLGFAVLGSLIPGVGLLAAGRRLAGTFVLAAWLGLVAGAITGVVILGRDGLITLGTIPASIRNIGTALLVIASLWLAVAVVSLFFLQQRGLNRWQRLSGSLAVLVVMTLIIAPLGIASQYTRTHTEFIERVFAADGERPSLTVPDHTPDHADPWAGMPRVNVLLLGSDAAPGRYDTRPDSLILASIDTESGQTTLLSLPRNLERVPFPEDSPLRERYPYGFNGPGDDRLEWMLNAIYLNVPAAHPDIFAGAAHPGADATKWAVEGALGLDVHYFVMINLAGFKKLVNALGGITLDVHYRVPMGNKQDPNTGLCTQPRDWIEPGLQQRLNGDQALWFARARCGPPPITSDFNRMERQRCVIGAIIDEAQPASLLRHYQRLAAAAGDMVQTDIPQNMLPAFVDLGLKVQSATVSSLAFTDEVLSSRSFPDFEKMHELAAAALTAGDEPVPRQADEVDEGLSGDALTGDPPDDTETAPDDLPGADLDPTVAQPVEAVC